ncbi:MAG: hypothetical protein CBB80_004295 [Synechococcus sp. TMED20]|nr:MAG: hypothetical protein CBB80_004295 [Synechococcus sp. TMED20]
MSPGPIDTTDQPDRFVEFLENWIPGISECTELHDHLHDHFQLGHHPGANFLHVVIFSLLSTTIYPGHYRNSWRDVRDFYRSYLLGRDWQLVSYWFIPPVILHHLS